MSGVEIQGPARTFSLVRGTPGRVDKMLKNRQKNFLTREKKGGNIARHSRRAGARKKAERGSGEPEAESRKPKRTLKIKQRRKTRLKKPLKINLRVLSSTTVILVKNEEEMSVRHLSD